MFYETKHPLNADYFQIERGQDFSFPPHIHHCFEIIIVKSGRMEITIGNSRRELRENEAAFIFPNQIHSLKTKEKSRHILCVFSTKLVNSFSKQTQELLPINSFFSLPERLVAQFEQLEEEKNISTVKGTLYTLCGFFDNHAKYYKRGSEKSDVLILRMFEYVNDNCFNSCSLKDLAEFLSYDYAYISRIFKQNVGLPYNTFLNQYRIREACYLIRTTNRSILQIATDCGYNSLRSFNRNFKNYIGMSPAEYRKSLTAGGMSD